MAGVTKADEGFDLSGLGLEVAPADDGAGVRITAVDPAVGRGRARPEDRRRGPGGCGPAGCNTPAEMRDALKAQDGKRVLMLVRAGDNQRYVALPRERS
jgi:hypothetical protein